MFDEQKVIEFQ